MSNEWMDQEAIYIVNLKEIGQGNKEVLDGLCAS
jgi:hypothetical protein